MSKGEPGNPEPGTSIACAGTGTTYLSMVGDWGGSSNNFTFAECLKLPLRTGGYLPMQWLRQYAGGLYQTFGDGFAPAGTGSARWSFFPVLIYQSGSAAVSTAVGQFGGSTGGVPGYTDIPFPWYTNPGGTYWTLSDESNSTYFVYSQGSGRLYRMVDRHGNELAHTIQTKVLFFFPVEYTSGMTGSALGRVAPYFDYYGGGTGNGDYRINRILFQDLDDPANSRSTYYFYAASSPFTLTRIVYPNHCTRQFSQSVWGSYSASRIDSETDAEGYVTSFEYASAGLSSVSKTIEPEGRITYFNYPAVSPSQGTSMAFLGRPCTYFNWIMTGSPHGSPLATRQVDPLGNTTLWGYDSIVSRVGQKVEPNGNLTYYSYASSASPIRYALVSSFRAADGAITYYQYKTTYDVTGVVGPRNKPGFLAATYYEYNSTREQTAVVDALGNRTASTIDGVGRRIATQNARGYTTYYNYGNATGHVDSVAEADGSTSYFGYTSFRELLRSVSPRWPEKGMAAFTTYYQYDLVSRLLQSTDALGNRTYFDWTSRGDLLAETDARGTETVHTYNGLRLRTQTQVLDSRGAQVAIRRDGYDIYKNRTRSLDGRGYATYFFYDTIDRLTAVKDALGNLSYFSYDPVGNPTTAKDARSNTTYYFYDTLSRQTISRNALGDCVYYFYDVADNRTAAADPLGNKTYFFYDQLDRLQATRDALSFPTYYFYDEAGNRTAVKDARFNTTYFLFDSRDRLYGIQDALKNVTYFTFDRAGNIVQALDPRNNATLTAYDVLDHVQATRDALGNSTYYFYDVVGNRTAIVDPRGNTLYFTYDALNRVTQVSNALGGALYNTYDLEGNLIQRRRAIFTVTAGYGSQPYGTTAYGGKGTDLTTFIYDAVSRLTASVETTGAATYFEYDAVGHLTKLTDPDNHAVQVQYDAVNRPSAIQMADGGSVYFFYDAAGNRTKEVDPRGNATYYTYDALNRMSLLRDMLGRSLYFGYDQVGNLPKYVDAELGTSYFTYDSINRRSSVLYTPAGADLAVSLRPNVYFVYDEMSNLVQMGDLSGLQLFGYDALNRLSQRKLGQGSAVYYFYDAVSNLTAKRYPGTSGVAYYAYDTLYRQTIALAPSGAAAYFVYDVTANPIRCVLGNAIKQSLIYDGEDRFQNWRYADKNGAALTYFDYTRDAKGLITKAVREANYTIYYSYDASDRLMSEIWAKTGATPSEVYGYRYAYDLAGNRTKLRANGANTYYFYDQANQLKVTGSTSAWATPSYYVYDKNGSLTNLVEPAGNTYFGYNTAGLVARIRWKDASATYFYYDGNLQRYAMTALGTTTYFVWDGVNLLQERNADGSVKEEYSNARSPVAGIGQLVEINRPGQVPQKLYPVMDPRGTVTKQLQSDGTTIQASKEYDAFGNIIPNSQTGTWIGRFTYQGQAWLEIGPADASKRLLLSPTRIYDPVTGRFLQNDLFLSRRPSFHYPYARQNPTNSLDVLGLQDSTHSGPFGPTRSGILTRSFPEPGIEGLTVKVGTIAIESDENEQRNIKKHAANYDFLSHSAREFFDGLISAQIKCQKQKAPDCDSHRKCCISTLVIDGHSTGMLGGDEGPERLEDWQRESLGRIMCKSGKIHYAGCFGFQVNSDRDPQITDWRPTLAFLMLGSNGGEWEAYSRFTTGVYPSSPKQGILVDPLLHAKVPKNATLKDVVRAFENTHPPGTQFVCPSARER